MGDFRTSIKIDLEINGKKYPFPHMWLYYIPSGCSCGMDARIADFFRRSWEDAQDTQELRRLQDKYPEDR